MAARLVFATRPSALARWQTRWVISALQAAHPGLECEERVITTQGDKILDKPLPEIGGKGLFTLELESELLKRINATGVGPGGVGGRITSLSVHVETHPAHIASLPVAVNIQCHSARHKEAVL